MNRAILKPHQKKKIRQEIRSISDKCGEKIEEEEIDFLFFLRSIPVEGLSLKKGGALCHIDYPINSNGEIDLYFHEKLIKYFFNRHWRELRERCLSVSPEMEHYNGTINSAWIHAMATNKGYRNRYTCKKSFAENKEMSLTINGPIITQIDANNISVNIEVPDTFLENIEYKTLNEVIELPHCGNEYLQEKINNQAIARITKSDGITSITTMQNMISLENQQGVYPWREIYKQSIRFSASVKTFNPLTYDRDKDAQIYKDTMEAFFAKNGTPETWYQRKAA